jgi:hypothetical protein
MWDVTVMGRGGQFFHLLASEDVNTDENALGVTVLAGFGGGNVNDLARAAPDHDVTTLTDIACYIIVFLGEGTG